MKVVLCNGCFDLLHPGHIAHLKAARTMGDRLIVALTLDAHVNKGPGRPVYTWEQRAAMLRELRCVDEVVPSRDSPDSILRYRPDVFVKGVDYRGHLSRANVWACEQVGAEIRFTGTPKMSATEIILGVKACA